MKDTGYEMEELLPLVARLAAKYTSGESTSVTYEAAGQLMEAVCYCIRENEKDSKAAKNSEGKKECELLEKQKITAAESYRQGYERVLEKTRRAQSWRIQVSTRWSVTLSLLCWNKDFCGSFRTKW